MFFFQNDMTAVTTYLIKKWQKYKANGYFFQGLYDWF